MFASNTGEFENWTQLLLHMKLIIENRNTPLQTTDEEQGWVPLEKVDREKFVDWMTRSVMSKNPRRSVIPGLDDEQLIRKEIELNMKCFIIDDNGWPRFVEKIMGITNDLGKLEFVTKFKYCNQVQGWVMFTFLAGINHFSLILDIILIDPPFVGTTCES